MSLSDTSIHPRDRIRPPAVAGLFYPDNPEELQDMVESLLAEAPPVAAAPKALIAPHAGYPFSGPVAARAYAALREVRQRIQRVVLLGPAHRVYLKGLALPGVDRFATPLGDIEIDREAVERIQDLPQVTVMEEAHRQEHSLEVHLPFLQRCLDRFRLVPLVVGDSRPEQVAQVLEQLWGGEETLILISSDLSHYNDYHTATSLDRTTAEHIRALRLEAIGPHQACGCMPIHGLLYVARQRNLRIDILDVRNSGDTAGPRDRVVGYGSFAVYPGAELDQRHHEHLHEIARSSIEKGLRGHGPLQPDVSAYRDILREKRAAFVTLFLEERLRGCIGMTEAEWPLVHTVAECAFKAAFYDPRFPALTAAEFEGLKTSISVLSPTRALQFETETELMQQLRPGVHGLTIAGKQGKATFLPAVWQDLPDPEVFLQHLKRKAGIPADTVAEKAWVYTAETF